MPSQLSRPDILQGFDLASRVEIDGGVRALTALAARLDQWLVFDQPLPPAAGVPARDGPPRGVPLGHLGAGHGWLLPRGEAVGPGGTEAVALPDAGLDSTVLAATVRRHLAARFVADRSLDELSPAALQAVVAEIIDVAWRADPLGRAALCRALAKAMGPGAGWPGAAARLKAGFERGLSDRSEAVRRVAARALVAMAAGKGPRPPVGEPWRVLYVLFSVPHPDVQAAALEALDQLPDAALSPLAPRMEDLLQDAVSSADADVRRRAAALRRRLHGEDDPGGLAPRLAAGDPSRIEVLRRLAADPQRATDFLPQLLEAAAEPGDVGAAAAEALAALMDAAAKMRPRILEALLGVATPGALDAALGLMDAADLDATPVSEGLKAALYRPWPRRSAAVGLLVAHYRRGGVATAGPGIAGLLHHPEEGVRLALLENLAAAPPRRQALAEDLLQGLVDHMRHDSAAIRVAAARAIGALGYPQGPTLIAQLALDPNPEVRAAALEVLRTIGSGAALKEAAQAASDVNRLLDVPVSTAGEACGAWMDVVEALDALESPFVNHAFAAALGRIPWDAGDRFRGEAIAILDDKLAARTGGGEALLVVCRHLLEGPRPQGQHAARLAGRIAPACPAAIDFLWTLYTEASGTWGEAARRALAGLADAELSPDAAAELAGLLARTRDPSRRDVLRTLLGRGRRA